MFRQDMSNAITTRKFPRRVSRFSVEKINSSNLFAVHGVRNISLRVQNLPNGSFSLFNADGFIIYTFSRRQLLRHVALQRLGNPQKFLLTPGILECHFAVLFRRAIFKSRILESRGFLEERIEALLSRRLL